MAITKNLKPIAEYQQWVASDITNGDILGVFESLGGRVADTLTIESIGGASTLCFNVCKKIYRNHSETFENWVGLGNGLGRSSSSLAGEIEEVKPNIIVESGATQTWTGDEIRIADIKIITKSSGLKITVT